MFIVETEKPSFIIDSVSVKMDMVPVATIRVQLVPANHGSVVSEILDKRYQANA